MRKLLVAVLVIFCAAALDAHAEPTRPAREQGYGQVRFNGHGPEWWAMQARQARREAGRLRRVLLARPSVQGAINLACATYRVPCSTLWRKADCETGGTFSPFAYNDTPHHGEHASGLFQFLPSTFASTPYARFSIWDPYANALAAGWMHANGRGGEWACR